MAVIIGLHVRPWYYRYMDHLHASVQHVINTCPVNSKTSRSDGQQVCLCINLWIIRPSVQNFKQPRRVFCAMDFCFCFFHCLSIFTSLPRQSSGVRRGLQKHTNTVHCTTFEVGASALRSALIVIQREATVTACLLHGTIDLVLCSVDVAGRQYRQVIAGARQVILVSGHSVQAICDGSAHHILKISK